MKLSERSIRIKELISEETCMGTFGLVELELKEFDQETEALKEQLKAKEEESDKLKNNVIGVALGMMSETDDKNYTMNDIKSDLIKTLNNY